LAADWLAILAADWIESELPRDAKPNMHSVWSVDCLPWWTHSIQADWMLWETNCCRDVQKIELTFARRFAWCWT
jgi:hypothetical protein